MASEFPVLLLLPLFLCLCGILVLLEIRRRQNDPNYRLIHPHVTEQNHEHATEMISSDDDHSGHENDDDNDDIAEGSSTAVRVKQIGKKKAEKLRRKEQMRQYREYMNQQNEARRVQDEILEEEFKRKKAEESIRRAEEMEAKRKAVEKKNKKIEAERQQKEKIAVKEAKQKRARYNKYSTKVKEVVQNLRFCALDQVGQMTGLAEEEVSEILQVLCTEDPEFELSLWSGSTFLFVTKDDYAIFTSYMAKNGSISVKDGLFTLLKQ
ncbi:hypothetical protein DFQ28_006927 [Apophysomyces sp. BC1034]|nr:hypothetical protein DFQ30_006808 [Apophysomyces sp. BC1015]KAG0174912.1 hypothetical protein DFQ29_007324 [Apophysomyces sp. BC1021]KAG0187059.1 hypothetical protein DFQ28_006927 [Apophysomyces sp. BC1034]